MAQMLYYPGSTPPEEALFQAVLYWDSVASIAPHEWRRYASLTETGQSMLELYDHGLYEPISLYEEGSSALAATFASERDRLLAQVGADDLVPPTEDDDADAVGSWYSISRFPEEWTRWLLDHGLARGRAGDQVWVDTKLRHVLFAVAADHLVRLNEGPDAAGPRRFTYTGDDGFFWAVNSPRSNPRPCWQLDVGQLFPMPASGTEIRKVVDFRQRYEDERLRLVHQVTVLQAQLAAVYDENPYEILQAMRGELVAALDDLGKAAKASRLTWIRRGLLSFLAIGATAAATELPDVTSLVVTMPVLGGIAVNLATNQIAAERAADHSYRYLQRATSAYGP